MSGKQYCRYCVHCYTGNGYWCDAKQREYSPATFKSPNKCKLFEYCEMDAFAENPNPYRPRQPYRHYGKVSEAENLSLFKEDNKEDSHEDHD